MVFGLRPGIRSGTFEGFAVMIAKVNLRFRDCSGHRRCDRPHSAERFEQTRPRARYFECPDRVFSQQSCSLPGYEDTGDDVESRAGEFDPADDLFEGFTGNAACEEFGQHLALCTLEQNGGLFFSEDTASGSQSVDE